MSDAVLQALIVDDRADEALRVERALTAGVGPKFQVTRCARIADAMECLKAARVDVVLLEPEAARAEADPSAAIRTIASMVPLVLVARGGTTEEAIETIGLGAQDYFWKTDLLRASLARAVRFAMARSSKPIQASGTPTSVDTIGRYNVLAKLASGGMGEVHLATLAGPHAFIKLVVLKRLHAVAAATPEMVGIFLDEARLTAQLNHRNIAQIHDLVETDSGFFVAMEFVRGPTLSELRDRLERDRRRLSPVLAVEIAQQVAEALAYAHSARNIHGVPLHIVHRDVTPQNILVSVAGDVKLIDFGFAKSAQQRQRTQMGVIKGKLSYLSPEQFRGEPLDGRSDLFSLGIVLSEMLSGANPFERNAPIQTARAIETEPPIFPSASDPALRVFDPLLGRLLAKSRNDRYAEAIEVCDDLAAIRAQLPPRATRLSELVSELFGAKILASLSSALRATTRLVPLRDDSIEQLDSTLVEIL